jgi:AcrR family transcriptional regulator
MGNREDLLAGAKRCLYEKGYARTTARDIAAAAGTSLAAIGYHYKSTEALLNQALYEAVGDMGEKMAAALRDSTAVGDPEGPPLQRFEVIWRSIIDSFQENRPVYAASLEIFGQMERMPELRAAFGDGIEETRGWWAKTLHDVDVREDEKTGRALGSFYQALMSGVMIQWLIDPDRAPSAGDLVEALRLVGEETR